MNVLKWSTSCSRYLTYSLLVDPHQSDRDVKLSFPRFVISLRTLFSWKPGCSGSSLYLSVQATLPMHIGRGLNNSSPTLERYQTANSPKHQPCEDLLHFDTVAVETEVTIYNSFTRGQSKLSIWAWTRLLSKLDEKERTKVREVVSSNLRLENRKGIRTLHEGGFVAFLTRMILNL